MSRINLKIVRSIMVIAFSPVLVCLILWAILATVAMTLFTANLKNGFRVIKFLFWAVYFDLRLFIHHGIVLTLVKN